MHNFKKGDVVRLIHLDGKLSDPVTIHDLWGDETHARNASFMSAGNTIEHHWHTDLMRPADDMTPIAIPDGLPNGGEWYIARGSNMNWGRARSETQAIRNMNHQGGSKATSYVVHRVSKWTTVDGMGSLSYPTGIEPVEVKRVEPKKAKA